MDKQEKGFFTSNGDDLSYNYKGIAYSVSYHPYEPCLYLYEGGRLVLTLHNAFTTQALIAAFAEGSALDGMDGILYDEDIIAVTLAAALDSGRGDMDLTYAAKRLAGITPQRRK